MKLPILKRKQTNLKLIKINDYPLLNTFLTIKKNKKNDFKLLKVEIYYIISLSNAKLQLDALSKESEPDYS